MPRKFEIDIATGVIKVAAALDFEGTGSGVYTVTVTAYDPSNDMGDGTRCHHHDDQRERGSE